MLRQNECGKRGPPAFHSKILYSKLPAFFSIVEKFFSRVFETFMLLSESGFGPYGFIICMLFFELS